MPGRKYDPARLARAELLPPPIAGTRARWTLGQRSLIDPTDHCWLWTGRVDKDGYARSTGGVAAYRLSYEYWVGQIPDGYHVDHVCHNVDPACTDGSTCLHRRCVRPDHLQARVAMENLGDQYPTRKTHCSNGHEFTPENTIRPRENSRARICRACRNHYTYLPSSRFNWSTIFERREQTVRPYDDANGLREHLSATDERTREVLLHGGHVALVDAEDWPRTQAYEWYLRVESGHWPYARGFRRVGRGETEYVMLHRLVMQPLSGQRVYHRNRNGLDNRRSNLRLGPAHRGTNFDPRLKKWRAYIRIDGRPKTIGHYSTEEEAIAARAAAEQRLPLDAS